MSSGEGTSIDTLDDANDEDDHDENNKQANLPNVLLPHKNEVKCSGSTSQAYNYSSTIGNGYHKPAIKS